LPQFVYIFINQKCQFCVYRQEEICGKTPGLLFLQEVRFFHYNQHGHQLGSGHEEKLQKILCGMTDMRNALHMRTDAEADCRKIGE